MLTYINPANVAKKVEIKMGKNISDGETEPFAALSAKIVTGMTVKPEALRTMNMICALVATFGVGFKV